MVDMPTLSILDMFSSLRRELQLIIGEELKKADFGPKQMMILYHLGANTECTMGELACVTLSDKATVTRAIASLERLDLIRRVSDKSDSRKTRIKLTAKGKLRANQAKQLRETIAYKMNETLSPHEQTQFIDLLSKVVNRLKSQRAESES